MERPNIEEEKSEVIAYIDYLENRVSGASKLSKEISLLKAGVAHDLELIRHGEQGDEYEHLKYICLDKLSPKYNLVKVLMLNIKSVEDDAPAKTARAKEAKESDEVETIPIAGDLDGKPTSNGFNMFEEMSRKITMKKVNGSR